MGIQAQSLKVPGSSQLTPEGEKLVRDIMGRTNNAPVCTTKRNTKVKHSDANCGGNTSDATENATENATEENNDTALTIAGLTSDLAAMRDTLEEYRTKYAVTAKALEDANEARTRDAEIIRDLKADITDLKSERDKLLAITAAKVLSPAQSAPDPEGEPDNKQVDGHKKSGKIKTFFRNLKKLAEPQ